MSALATEWAELEETPTVPEEASTESSTYAATLAGRRFDMAHPPPTPVPVYTLAQAIIATAGNIVALQAQAKAGKSAFIGAMLGAAMGGVGDCLGIASSNSRGLALVHFDTEQSPADHHAGIVRAFHRAGLQSPPPWLRSYRLADVGIDERRGLLRFELEAARKARGAIHSVLLDGVADFCHDPNNPEEAFGLVGELHRLAIDYATAILCVLHENPGSQDGKTRGHLGSQLERKAETNLRLAKDGEGITVVFAERARHAHIPRDRGQRFKWCDETKMHVSTASAAETRGSAKRDRLAALATECFRDSGGVGMTWKQVHEQIKKLDGLKSQSGARKKFDAMLAAKVIRKVGDKYWPV